MTKSLVKTPEVQALLNKLSGQDQPGGDARVKAIVRRIVGDLFAVIDEFQVTDDEFWAAIELCLGWFKGIRSLGGRAWS